MTVEDVKKLKLPIKNINESICLQIESALEWVNANTKLDFDISNIESIEALPSSVRLFILKYLEVMSLSAGITSESIEGLSQSFDTKDKSSLLKQYAKIFLKPYLKSEVKFIVCPERWRDF